MGEINSALGGAISFDALGRTVRISAPRQHHLGKFEDYIEYVLYARLKRKYDSGALSFMEYQSALAQLDEHIAEGVYSWGKPGCMRELKRLKAQCFFYTMLMKEHDSTITEDVVHDIIISDPDGFARVVERILDSYLHRKESGSEDPQKPATTTSL